MLVNGFDIYGLCLTESVCLQDCKGMVGFHLVVKSISVCVLVLFCLSCVPVETGTYGVQVKELR